MLDDLALPDFLARTPERSAQIHEAVRRLDAAERRAQRAAFRRAILHAASLRRKRCSGRKSPGQCRALERLGYTKYAIGRIERTDADSIIMRRVPYRLGRKQ